jgi:hypothetical protein
MRDNHRVDSHDINLKQKEIPERGYTCDSHKVSDRHSRHLGFSHVNNRRLDDIFWR